MQELWIEELGGRPRLKQWLLIGAAGAVLIPGGRLAAREPTNSTAVVITVDAAKTAGKLSPVWGYFGYDEPNFTYSANGKKLVGELAALSPAPVYLRTHNLFTSGDGTGSLKWGSTNIYTEHSDGTPVYDWTIVDRIFDVFKDAGVRPLVELGFMPESMTTGPPPYRHSFPKGDISTAWAYPPRDYSKWGELVFQFAKHLRERYGDDAVKGWLWEVWNEPDIFYWRGTEEEYFKLYDYSAEALLRGIPYAKIGGPDSTGPGNARAAGFLKDFLEHCANGKNYATGRKGAPLAFISFHPKGSPKWVDEHVRMGMSAQLAAIDAGFKIVASFPHWRKTPIILGEWDPEGCAACSAKTNPQNGYRNGPLYASYTTLALKSTLELAASDDVNLQGLVTWAFQFDDQPYFEGLRELASNGIDKPVLSAFRMLGLLGTTRVAMTSSQGQTGSEIERNGVRGAADIDGMAARRENEVGILVWNYHDDDVNAPGAEVQLEVKNLPARDRVLVEQYRVDGIQSNAFAAWNSMGSPQSPTLEQYQKLEAAGQLHLAGSPEWNKIEQGSVTLKFVQPRQGLSLFRIDW